LIKVATTKLTNDNAAKKKIADEMNNQLKAQNKDTAKNRELTSIDMSIDNAKYQYGNYVCIKASESCNNALHLLDNSLFKKDKEFIERRSTIDKLMTNIYYLMKHNACTDLKDSPTQDRFNERSFPTYHSPSYQNPTYHNKRYR